MSLALAALVSFSATAGTVRFDRGGLNARSANSFRGKGNVLTTVPKGTTGEVLERWQLPSGNYSVKIKITKVGDAGTTLKEGEEIWVYYHNDETLRRITLMDDEGTERKPGDEEGKWAVALSSFKTRRSEEKKKVEPCTTCGTSVSENGADPIVTVTAPLVNHQEIVEAAETVVDIVNEAPVMDVSDQEMLTYLNTITDTYNKATYEIMTNRKVGSMSKAEYEEFRKEQREKNPLIAKTLIAECNAQGIPIELGLALMRQESAFITKAKSSSSAYGLMQMLGSTYKELSGAQDLSKIYDVETNIRHGLAYFKKLIVKYNGDYKIASGAYNAGPGNMDAYLKRGRPLKGETHRHMAAMTTHSRNYLAYMKKSSTRMLASN